MTYLLKFAEAHQILLATIIGIMGFGLNMMYNSFFNSQIKGELSEIRNQTIHSRIDAYAVGMAKFRDSAYKLEVHDTAGQKQIEELIQCVQRDDCKKHPHLLKVPEKANVDIMKAYDAVQEGLIKINQKME